MAGEESGNRGLTNNEKQLIVYTEFAAGRRCH